MVRLLTTDIGDTLVLNAVSLAFFFLRHFLLYCFTSFHHVSAFNPNCTDTLLPPGFPILTFDLFMYTALSLTPPTALYSRSYPSSARALRSVLFISSSLASRNPILPRACTNLPHISALPQSHTFLFAPLRVLFLVAFRLESSTPFPLYVIFLGTWVYLTCAFANRPHNYEKG